MSICGGGEARKAPPTVVIHVEGENWGAPPADVDKVLHSAAAQVLAYFPGREIKPILVSRGRFVPITLDQKGPGGEFQVHLATGNTYWAQYTYQFAHEVCHILANCDRHQRGRHQWFEESLCETSSLFVLSRMHKQWEEDPPYPNWKSWGVHFDEYLNQMLAERARRLPPDQTMGQWIRLQLPVLVTERKVTEHSKLMAAYLLPIFQDDPQGWESLNWYHTGDRDNDLEFEAFLRAWKLRVPEKHKTFVAKIQKLFGYN